jgi:hypothetical protein
MYTLVILCVKFHSTLYYSFSLHYSNTCNNVTNKSMLLSLLYILTLHVATPTLNYVKSYSSPTYGLYVRDRFTCKYMPFMNYAVNLLRTREFRRKQYVGKLCSVCNQGYVKGLHNSRRTHDSVRRQNVSRILNTTWHYHTSQRIAQLHASRYSLDF